MEELQSVLVRQAKLEGIQKIVVGAVIAKAEKRLIIKRRPEDYLGGLYEIPGGGVEKHETLEMAVVREVMEETALRVTSVKRYLGYFDYRTRDGSSCRQFNFEVEVEDATNITLTEHDHFQWISVQELSAFEISESTQNVFLGSMIEP